MSICGGDEMPTAKEYQRKAADLRDKASREPRHHIRNELQTLAMAYMRLAEMAERNRLSERTEDQ